MDAPSLKPTSIQSILQDERQLVLRVVQPGLAGLMDGSVSTLAPIFATAFATHRTHTVFLIGAASAVGAGISMAFSEGLSDDGELTGRGKPLMRGLVTGFATFIGGFLHTLPFLIPNIRNALIYAYAVVGVELLAIAWIRYRYMKTSFALSCLQVIVGGGFGVCRGRADWAILRGRRPHPRSAVPARGRPAAEFGFAGCRKRECCRRRIRRANPGAERW